MLAMLMVRCDKVMKVMNTRQIKMRMGEGPPSLKLRRIKGEWVKRRMGEIF
jgi:hypothetical protein